jgi:hypothetical protein
MPQYGQVGESYSNALVFACQATEWGMRAFQGVFGQLQLQLDVNNPQSQMQLLEVVVRLHNLRTCLVGINRTCTVYGDVV